MTIGLIAPASPPLNNDRLQDGIAHLVQRGYQVETFRPTYPTHGYLAGSDQERIAELNTALRRPDLHTLFCVRGGYGSLRLLPHIDYEAAREHPKLLVGYSDITALQLALFRKAGLPSLSGSMVAVEWAKPLAKSEHHFWQSLMATPPYDLIDPSDSAFTAVRPGTAEGPLLGGNLTLITKLIGTPYLPELKGCLLFIEEVAEPPYRIDGMLAQLKLSGLLDQLGGLIIGGLTGWTPNPKRPTLSYEEVIAHYTQGLDMPVAKGLAYGHFPEKYAMPIGVRARLDVSPDRTTLTVLESLTA